ncbi:unnamed protein product, partial [Durusdinium trenchii]
QTNVHSGVSTAKLDNYVPVFSNNMQDYREFRKRCEIYRKKMQLGNRTNEVVYNLVTLMTGKAWDLVEDMTMEQMSGEDAYDLLFTRLDRGFRFDPLTELPDDFEQYFVKLQRKPHQTLQDYMNDYTRCERRLKVTHNVELPEKVRAWWFLRRSGITKEQRQLILTNTGTTGLTIEEVMKSMSFILGQDSTLQSSSSTSRWSRPMGKPVDTFYCDEDTQYDWPAGSEDFAIDPSPTYFGEDYEWDDWHEGSSEQFDEVALAEHCEQVYDVDEYDDVLANYQDAKAQMNALRTSRGFYPVVAMLPSGVNMVESVEPPVDTTLSTEAFNIDIEEDDFVGDDTAVQDGGAASVLGSACQIRKYLRFLLEQGYNIHDIPMFHCEKGFKYGNSMKETTNKCIVLPVFLSNSRIDVLTYVIQGTAPILVGRPMLEKLGLIVDYRSKQMKWPDTDWEDLPTGSKGEHLLHLGKDIRRCIAQEPTMVLLPEDVESHVGEPIEQGVQKLLEEVMIAENANPALEPTQTVTSAHTRRVNDGIEEIDTVKRLHGHMLRKFERQEENEPESVLAEEDGDVEMIPVEQQPQQLEAQAEVPDVEQDILKYYREYAEKEVDSVTSNAQLRTQVGKAAMNYVVRLHKNLGHPGTDVLCRMREEVQATDNVMTAAKRYVCPECYIRQGPAGVPPAEDDISELALKRARNAISIPVPDSDEDLFIDDAYIVEMESGTLPKGWRLIDGEFELDEMFLAEVSEKRMTLAEKEEMIKAKQQELRQYFDNKVWEFAELGQHQRSRLISARWVLVWKPPKEGEFQRRAKARLVLRGCEDPDYLNLEKASPTANKTSKMILLGTIFRGDVRAALLSGATFDREIIVKLPADCSAMLGAKGPTFMRMRKSAYGLCDAPLLWWREADQRLRQLGLKRHRLCKCTYMMYNSATALVGLIILHVDDLLLSVNMKDKEAVQILQKVKSAFDFGKWQELSQKEDIIYCGGRIAKKGET